MSRTQRMIRGFHALLFFITFFIAGCSSTDPNAWLPAMVTTANETPQPLKPQYRDHPQTGLDVFIAAGENNGSYQNVRRALFNAELPQESDVQLMQWVNFFPYDYPKPQGRMPFAMTAEMAKTPWNSDTVLLRVAMKADEPQAPLRRAANLVVYVGTKYADLTLIQQSLTALVAQLTAQDTLAIITTADNSEIALAPTKGDEKAVLLKAIDNLNSGDRGNRLERLSQAYALANMHFIPDGINRVILIGSEEFNAGFENVTEVDDFFRHHNPSGVSLTAVSVAVKRFTPLSLAQIAAISNGAHHFVDNQRDADRLWAMQLSTTQTHVADNFAMNVEFNTKYVKAYRLLGDSTPTQQSRHLGDKNSVIAGQTLTALYEVIPAQSEFKWENETASRVFTPSANGLVTKTDEMAIIHLRYQNPRENGGGSQLIELPVPASKMDTPLDKASNDFRFAAAVAAFAQQLTDSDATTASFTLSETLKLASNSVHRDRFGLRNEFVQLIENAQEALLNAASVQ